MKTKITRLYNVIFPIHALILIPFFEPELFYFVLLILFGNWIIDGTVLVILLRVFHQLKIVQRFLTLWVKVWLIGFLADLFGAGLLYLFESAEWFNPYGGIDSFQTFFFTIAGIGLAGVLIFLGDRFVILRHGVPGPAAFNIALGMGIITAPWLFLLPPLGG